MALPYSDRINESYEIKCPLFRGLGGNGRVFLARSKVARLEVARDEEVAIKVPLVPGTSFQHEMAIADALRRLRAPGIVDIYETAVENGGHYIVMEYLPGYDLLTEVTTNGPLSLQEALETTIRICQALSFLHSHGIYHGDVKPENIVRSRSGIPKLVDFGHSRMFSLDGSEEAERTRALNKDILQIGELLYYSLTGLLPFFARLESMARHQKLVNPCASLPYIWRKPAVAVRLGRMILRCLELDPEARPALEEVLGEMEWCYQTWMADSNGEKSQWGDLFGAWAITSATKSAEEAPKERDETGSIRQRLDNMRSALIASNIERGSILALLGHLREAEAVLRQALTINPDATEAWHDLGMILLQQGALNEAIWCFRKARSFAPKSQPTRRALRILAGSKKIIGSAIEWYRENGAEAPGEPLQVGNAYAALGLWDDSIRQYFKALQRQPTNIRTKIQLAHAYKAKGLLNEAMEELEAALILNPENVQAHTDLAANLRRVGAKQDALLHLQTVLGMNPFFEPAILELGLTYLDLGDYTKAELAFKRLAKVNPESEKAAIYLAYFAATEEEHRGRVHAAIRQTSDFLLSENKERDTEETTTPFSEVILPENPSHAA